MSPKRSFGRTVVVRSTAHYTKPHKLVKEAPQSKLLVDASGRATAKGVINKGGRDGEALALVPLQACCSQLSFA